MGWFYGFNLRLIVDDTAALLAIAVTAGNVDSQPVRHLARGLWGNLFGDRGYIAHALGTHLLAHGLHLVTKLRENMKISCSPCLINDCCRNGG